MWARSGPQVWEWCPPPRQLPWRQSESINRQLAARAKDDVHTGDLLPSLGQSGEIWEDAAWLASVQSIESLVAAVSDNSDRQLVASIMDRLESVEASLTKSSQVVEKRGQTAYELSKRSSIALEKVSEHLKHLAAPSASLAVQSANRSKA